MEALKKKTTRELIYEEAAQLFREKGYASSSMRELAARVGLRASSFYNHIQSKEDLLQEICFANAEKFLNGIAEVEASGDSPLDKIRALIRLHIRIAAEDISSVTVFNDEWRHLSEPQLSRFQDMRDRYEESFLGIIEAGSREEAFKDLHPKIVLYTFLNSLRWIYYWIRPGRTLDLEKLQKDMETLLLEGLKK
jgi:AcrR family transcriptional regulator